MLSTCRDLLDDQDEKLLRLCHAGAISAHRHGGELHRLRGRSRAFYDSDCEGISPPVPLIPSSAQPEKEARHLEGDDESGRVGHGRDERSRKYSRVQETQRAMLEVASLGNGSRLQTRRPVYD